MAAASFPVTADEPERLRVLERYGILAASAPPDLASLVELAAYTCQVPHAVINIISAEHANLVASLGFEPTQCARSDSMCAVTIVEPEPVFVPDARVDPRFADNPYVSGALGDIRFYAASQLRAPEGPVLGTLCVFDTQVRRLTVSQRDALDKLAAMVVDVLDLHRHQRLLHQALEAADEARAELERSNSALQQFAGQVSHDLRNPLTGILGHADNLIDIPAIAGDPDASFCAQRVIRSANRMRTMIEDVLALASAGGQLHLETVDLNALAHAVIEDLDSPIRTHSACVTVERLPTLSADPTQLRVLLQNLVSNALKFRRPERPCQIVLAAEPHPRGWDIAVIDNGRGIPPQDRQRVMDMFTRLDKDVEGSGIGLATCHRIATAHGGSLRLEETPGGGTTAVLTLPSETASNRLRPTRPSH
ncbi:GAF domain-containing sensor histidine kinase [Streptomyces sp. NPDC006332]|uniref:GAF domain-containing sensor histidine kinase n=1 Tax=Streptomyces sp. NPDC006332 TaxID=3155456 RepID=UPI0033BE39FE